MSKPLAWVRVARALAAAAVICGCAFGASARQALTPAQAAERVRARYTKYEYLIPMRDGARLFTAVYVPKDSSRPYPFMLVRTPYSVAPYGVDNYRAGLGPSEHFEKEGFIFVYQDARGRYMSEGEFQQVRPHVPDKRGPKEIDESTDTYDTVEWLLKNVANHNGRAGMWGVSQPGFHVAAGIIDTHPALKAASPQAPTADYFMGDDVYHNGAFMLAANFGFYSSFVPRAGTPAPPPRQRADFDPGTPDSYEFFLGLGPLATVNERLLGGRARYWQEIVDHTTYDDFWKRRSLWRFMSGVRAAVLNVGGWFDAEDPVGPFHIYRAVEQKNPGAVNLLVMGPWRHGGWTRQPGDRLGNVSFAFKSAEVYREQIEFPFFMRHLKDQPAELPEAFMFLTGINEWRRHGAWPPAGAAPLTLYFREAGRLAAGQPAEEGRNVFDEYTSDPNRPVPYLGYVTDDWQSEYVTEDQRFAAQRPDVLTYVTEPLEADLVVAGPVKVRLHVSTSGTDSDFVVKLVDVYPPTYPQPPAPEGQPAPPNAVRMGGYQQLVRGEPFRGKFRNSFERPEPFTPNQPAAINFELPDVYHAFRRGHRLMIQVQSSWFPLVDRNPQKFMEIPRAAAADFQKATQRLHRSRPLSSSITLLIEGQAPRL
ncbi:MAG TPA: CocE/NonD family hydrolase [Pyrinomonadaceae bacterium]|nr:CocE/NonD family hydrolase [Pyrinomonadaceae bacterium]